MKYCLIYQLLMRQLLDALQQDFDFHSGTCLNDGGQPAYMALNAFTWLYSTLEQCCNEFYFGWNLNKCMNVKGSGLWFVSQVYRKCVRDCMAGVRISLSL